MLGQEVSIGTGSVDVLFDEEKYMELSKELVVDYMSGRRKRRRRKYRKTRVRTTILQGNYFKKKLYKYIYFLY